MEVTGRKSPVRESAVRLLARGSELCVLVEKPAKQIGK